MRLIRAQKFSAFFADSGKPCSVRFFWRVIGAQRFEGARAVIFGSIQMSDKSAVLEPPDTARQNPFGTIPVPFVLLMRRFAQIVPAIICPIAVLMVDLIRPVSRLHHPNDAMSEKHAPVKTDIEIARVRTARLFTRVAAVPFALIVRVFEMMQRARPPYQHTRIGVIVETFPQILCGRQPFRHRECVA